MKARIAAAAVLAGALLVGTTGCSFFATQSTLEHYDPSDGVGATIGSLDVRNALLLTGDKGKAASLVIDFINSGDKNVDLKVQYVNAAGKKKTTAIPVDAGDTLSFGDADEQQLVFTDVKATPGALFDVWFQYGTRTGKLVRVPVLDGSLSEYSTLIPTPIPTPTNTTPAPTGTPTSTTAP